MLKLDDVTDSSKFVVGVQEILNEPDLSFFVSFSQMFLEKTDIPVRITLRVETCQEQMGVKLTLM